MKRFASSIGTHAVKGAIEMGVAGWNHEDNGYNRSGIMAHGRVSNSLVVHRNNQQGRTSAIGRLSGAFGAGLISRAWQPASTAGIGMGIAVAADVGVECGSRVLAQASQARAKPPWQGLT